MKPIPWSAFTSTMGAAAARAAKLRKLRRVNRRTISACGSLRRKAMCIPSAGANRLTRKSRGKNGPRRAREYPTLAKREKQTRQGGCITHPEASRGSLEDELQSELDKPWIRSGVSAAYHAKIRRRHARVRRSKLCPVKEVEELGPKLESKFFVRTKTRPDR